MVVINGTILAAGLSIAQGGAPAHRIDGTYMLAGVGPAPAYEPTIIQLNSDGTIPINPAEAGVINVKDTPYNAVGNGIADDTSSIQSAINAASLAGGGTVFFPTGTYKTTAVLTLHSNVILLGVEYGSVISANFSGDVFVGASISHAAIKSLRIAGAYGRGINISNSTYIEVDNCDISGATVLSINFDTAGMQFIECSYVYVHDNYLHGNGLVDGALGQIGEDIVFLTNGGVPNTYITIENNICTSNALHNIKLIDGQYSKVVDNLCSGAKYNVGNGNGGYGIVLYGVLSATTVQHNVVANNVVTNTEGSGIYLQQTGHSTCIGNTCKTVASLLPDTSILVGGIALTGNYNTISGNTVEVSGKAGIVTQGLNNIVQDNAIDNCSGAGIWLRGTCDGSSVIANSINNSVRGISTVSTAQNGVTLQGNIITSIPSTWSAIDCVDGLTNSSINNNVITSCGARGIIVSGSSSHNTIIGNNIKTPGVGGNYEGIYSSSTYTIITANHVTSGPYLGIGEYIGTGVVVSNNVLQGNGTPLSVTAGAVQFNNIASAINSIVGSLLFTDNTYDIGASGATRPRTGYFGTSIVAPTVNATTALQINGVSINTGGTLANVAYLDQANSFSANQTLGASNVLLWSTDVSVRRSAAASLLLGAANSASPVSYTLTGGESSRGGTDSNLAGGSFTIASGLGTGTGAVSSLVFQTPTVAVSGTTAQVLATRLTLSSASALFAAPIQSAVAGALSNPAVSLTGTWITGGTGTTTKPYVLIEPAGATVNTAYSTGGTALGINAGSGFAGDFIRCSVNGGAGYVLILSSAGALTASSLVSNAGLRLSGAGGPLLQSFSSLISLTANTIIGSNPSASPSAFSLFVGESSRSGTDSNIGGANGIVASGTGTGTGTPATLALQSPVAVASGTGAQTLTTGLLIKVGAAVLTNYIVANLPAAATAGAGATAFVTDANTTFILGLGVAVVGGGANKVPVYSDGTSWIVG